MLPSSHSAFPCHVKKNEETESKRDRITRERRGSKNKVGRTGKLLFSLFSFRLFFSPRGCPFKVGLVTEKEEEGPPFWIRATSLIS